MWGNSQTKDNLGMTRQQQKETARNYNAIFKGIWTSVGLLWNREGLPPSKKSIWDWSLSWRRVPDYGLGKKTFKNEALNKPQKCIFWVSQFWLKNENDCKVTPNKIWLLWNGGGCPSKMVSSRVIFRAEGRENQMYKDTEPKYLIIHLLRFSHFSLHF